MAGFRWIVPFALGPALLVGPAPASSSAPDSVVSAIDLSKPFATRSPWRFTATQGPAIQDPIFDGGTVPGRIRLCIASQTQSCRPDLAKTLSYGLSDDIFDEPHFLLRADIVHPRGPAGRALFLLRFGSLLSANGDQRIATTLLAYDRAKDGFGQIFTHVTGHNNNQEVRYVDHGLLEGAVIVAEPTENAPYGFWITVNRLSSSYSYQQVLRYRSATRYGDGNPLAVIDSDMPNIQRRLGLWRPGKPLPLPARGCARPRLVHMELWCG